MRGSYTDFRHSIMITIQTYKSHISSSIRTSSTFLCYGVNTTTLFIYNTLLSFGSSTYCPMKTFYSTSKTLQMTLQTAIIGLPNVGKSTLFNALTETGKASAENYPFCTIKPNFGIAEVSDSKLQKLAKINKSKQTIPATLEFIDVAGLVKGAAVGEGLGNQFLATIRQCDIILHVVRCFQNDDILHIDKTINPIRDVESINLELAFADLYQVEKRLERIRKKRKKVSCPDEQSALEKIHNILCQNEPALNAILTEKEEKAIYSLGLLTKKKVIYAANISDENLRKDEQDEMVKKLNNYTSQIGSKLFLVSAQVESELIELDHNDRLEYIESLGLSFENHGLRKLIKEAYDLLQLRTFYTSGSKETRAWSIQKGWTAPMAAGVIHNDLKKGFICAETMSYDDLISCGSGNVAKNKGLLRKEGKDYIVQDGDVILFRFNVQ